METFIGTQKFLKDDHLYTVSEYQCCTPSKYTLCKWGHFDLEYCQPLEFLFNTISNRFRSLIAKNLGSVGQRAAKLLANFENDSTPSELKSGQMV